MKGLREFYGYRCPVLVKSLFLDKAKDSRSSNESILPIQCCYKAYARDRIQSQVVAGRSESVCLCTLECRVDVLSNMEIK